MTPEIVLGLLSVLLSGMAAYFAWRNYRRRPKLKLYVGDKGNPIRYDDQLDDTLAYVHATLANIGETAAHNIHGWLQFEPPERVQAVKRTTKPGWPEIDPHIMDARENWATFYLDRLMPRSYSTGETLTARAAKDSPRHFVIPVRVADEGQARLSYRFVSGEGAEAKKVVALYFPKHTSGKTL